MSTKTLLATSFVLLLAATSLTGCAETVSASSRREPGSGALAALGGGREANTPPPAENRAFDRPMRDRDPAPREAREARFEFVCRQCR